MTLMSLLLCVAAVGLWMRSYYVADWLQYARARPAADCIQVAAGRAATGRGQVSTSLTLQRFEPQSDHFGFGWRWETDDPVHPETRRWPPARCSWGFGYDHAADSFGLYRSWVVCLPLWVPGAVFALLPSARLYRRFRRHTPGLCPICGYDLRATPDRC